MAGTSCHAAKDAKLPSMPGCRRPASGARYRSPCAISQPRLQQHLAVLDGFHTLGDHLAPEGGRQAENAFEDGQIVGSSSMSRTKL